MKAFFPRINKAIKAVVALLIILGALNNPHYEIFKASAIIANNPSDINDFYIVPEKVITIGEIDVIEPEFDPPGASGFTIFWTSSNEAVASVSKEGEIGIITGKSMGTTTITATLNANGRTIAKTIELRVASKGRDTILVLDVSGSMEGVPLREMKTSAIKFCEDLMMDKYNNRVGLVWYDSYVDSFDLTEDLDALIYKINTLSHGSSTNMEGGLASAKQMMDAQGRSGAIKNIVLMTDGCPNHGKTSSSGSFKTPGYPYFNAVVDTAMEVKRSSYNLYSLGFFHSLGAERDDAIELMQKIATPDTNEMRYFYIVDRAEDLQYVFGDVTGSINLGSRITINIACPVDVTVTNEGESLRSDINGFNDKTTFGSLKILGKDQDIKVLTLKPDKIYDVELRGTGIGEMDYSVYYIDDNENIYDYRRFGKVPITENMMIYTSTDASIDTELHIDKIGNGIIDEILKVGKMGEWSQNEANGSDMTVVILAVVISAILFIAIIAAVILATTSKSEKKRSYEDYDIPIIRRDPNNGYTEPIGSNNGDDNTAPVTEPLDHNPYNASAGSLSVISGSMQGTIVPIMDGETISIGTDSAKSHLILSNDYRYVSGMHCTVTYNAQHKKYYVVDCSKNGTYKSNHVKFGKDQRTAVEPNSVILLANEQCSILLK